LRPQAGSAVSLDQQPTRMGAPPSPLSSRAADSRWASWERNDQHTAPAANARVAHSSPVLGEEWDTTALNAPPSPLSSRLSRRAVGPKRTRISCCAALTSNHVCGFLARNKKPCYRAKQNPFHTPWVGEAGGQTDKKQTFPPFNYSHRVGRVPHFPPDFLSRLVALTNFMRLSLQKAAHVGVGWCSVQEIRVASAYVGRERRGEAPRLLSLAGRENNSRGPSLSYHPVSSPRVGEGGG
jgi:hypothetical protein